MAATETKMTGLYKGPYTGLAVTDPRVLALGIVCNTRHGQNEGVQYRLSMAVGFVLNDGYSVKGAADLTKIKPHVVQHAVDKERDHLKATRLKLNIEQNGSDVTSIIVRSQLSPKVMKAVDQIPVKGVVKALASEYKYIVGQVQGVKGERAQLLEVAKLQQKYRDMHADAERTVPGEGSGLDSVTRQGAALASSPAEMARRQRDAARANIDKVIRPARQIMVIPPEQVFNTEHASKKQIGELTGTVLKLQKWCQDYMAAAAKASA